MYWNESRRGNGRQIRAALIGLPGVYLCICSSLEHSTVLFVVGIAFLAAGTIGQLVAFKQSGGQLLPPGWRARRVPRERVSKPAERKYDEW